MKKQNVVCQSRIEAFSTKISSKGVLEYTVSIYFFEILKYLNRLYDIRVNI